MSSFTGTKGDRAKLLCLPPVNGQKTMDKKSFSCESGQEGSEVSERDCKISILGLFKPHMNLFQDSLLEMLCYIWTLDQIISRGLFQLSLCCFEQTVTIPTVSSYVRLKVHHFVTVTGIFLLSCARKKKPKKLSNAVLFCRNSQ